MAYPVHPVQAIVAGIFFVASENVAGCSGSGKTVYVTDMILNDRIKGVETVLYCYNNAQPVFDKLRDKVQFHKGVPSESLLESLRGKLLLVLDDLMSKFKNAAGAQFLEDIFTRVRLL